MNSKDIGDLYLDLIENALLGLIYQDAPQDPWTGGKFQIDLRQQGKDWPSQAHSMIGTLRMRNLRLLCEDVIAKAIPGDFIETGAWRGDACIMMRAVLKVHGVTDRRVWVCDSFEGLPMPYPAKYPHDAGDKHAMFEALAISLDQVRANFAKYGLLDDQVKFLKGWFKDTLPSAPVGQLAILRLDGDMYQSTMEALQALYHKLSIGGYLIIDDFGAVPGCKQAVIDFRKQNNIVDEMQAIDWTGAFMRKTR